MLPGNVVLISMSQYMSWSSLFTYIQDSLVSSLGVTRCIASWACLRAERGGFYILDPARWYWFLLLQVQWLATPIMVDFNIEAVNWPGQHSRFAEWIPLMNNTIGEEVELLMLSAKLWHSFMEFPCVLGYSLWSKNGLNGVTGHHCKCKDDISSLSTVHYGRHVKLF